MSKDLTPAPVRYPAHFESNRWEGVTYPYLDSDFETTEPGAPAGRHFHRLVELADGMISNSYGWDANRAEFVYLEAWREHARRERKAAEGARDAAAHARMEQAVAQSNPGATYVGFFEPLGRGFVRKP